MQSEAKRLETALGRLLGCGLLLAWLLVGLARAQDISEARLADRAFASSKQAAAIAQTRGTWATRAKWPSGWKKTAEQQRQLLECVSKEWENQIRFEAAVGALRLHYGIAATQAGLSILRQAQAFIQEQASIQDELIDLGGQVEDPTALGRSAIELQDRRLELESKRSQMRQQLSLLVGSEIACDYESQFACAPAAELNECCEYESWAIDQRCELRVLRWVRNRGDQIDQDMVSVLSGLPIVPAELRAIWGPIDRPSFLGHKHAADLLAKRLDGLDRWIAIRTDQIRLEVSTAFRAKQLAQERWQLAIKKTDTLEERYERLRSLSELKGNLSEQIQAKLDIFRAQGEEVQRWLEWHLADCELQQASGQIGFWSELSESCASTALSGVRVE